MTATSLEEWASRLYCTHKGYIYYFWHASSMYITFLYQLDTWEYIALLFLLPQRCTEVSIFPPIFPKIGEVVLVLQRKRDL
jgi:hypothetical protein